MPSAIAHNLRRILLTPTLALAIATAQPPAPASAPPPLEFEVASVKLLGHPPGLGGGPWIVTHGRFQADAAWVRAVIAFAYSTMAAQVHGGPSWIDADRYDFVAKAESPDATTAQLRVMLQSLLADRFKLVVHRETKELSTYTLVVGKNGPKMQEAKDGEKTYGTWAGRGQIVCTRMNLRGLINILSGTLASPVLDKTGLTGFYDFKLAWTDPRFQKPGNDSQLPADARPDIFGAVQEQLGLKLEAKKGPVQVLIVDRAEKPSQN